MNRRRPGPQDRPQSDRGNGLSDWARLAGMVGVALLVPIVVWLLLDRLGERRAPAPTLPPAKDPRVEEALRVGVSRLKAGDLASAERAFESALVLDEISLDARMGLGLARFFAGRYAEAERAFDRAAASASTSVEVLLWLFLARARQGPDKARDARDGLRVALKHAAPHPLLTPLARLHVGLATPDECLALLGGRPDAPPEWAASVQFHLGEHCLLQGDVEGARQALRAAAEAALDALPVLAARHELQRIGGPFPPDAPPQTSDGATEAAGDAVPRRVFHDGRWLTFEELMSAHGYVRRGGAWQPQDGNGSEPTEASAPRATSAEATGDGSGVAAPSGGPPRTDSAGQPVTPEQRSALLAQERARRGPRDDGASAPDAGSAMRADGLVPYAGQRITRAQHEAMLARERQIAAFRRTSEGGLAGGASDAPMRRRFPEGETLWVIDPFERALEWSVAPWGNPCTLSVRWVEGRALLEAALRGGERLNTALQRTVALDLRECSALCLDLENPGGAPVRVALALETSEYFETPARLVPPGRATLFFPLGAGDFKCASSGWQHGRRLEAPEAVARVGVIFYANGPAMLRLRALTAER